MSSTTAAAVTAAAFLAWTSIASADDIPGRLDGIEPVPFGEYVERFVEGEANVVSYEVEPTAAGLVAVGIFTYDERRCLPPDEHLARLRRIGAAYAGEVVYDDKTFAHFAFDTTLYDRPVILVTLFQSWQACVTNILLVEWD